MREPSQGRPGVHRGAAGGAHRLRHRRLARRSGRRAAGGEDTSEEQEWFVQEDFDTQDAQRDATFEGDPAQPWLQYIDGEMTDTAEFKSSGAKKVCFANASISNPWRQTGWITMNQQLQVLQDSGVISEMETRDAEDDDNTQISDIQYFIDEGNCDAFVISPNSTAAMTPAVEDACATGKPVVVFDRGVETDCATTFIHPIGGYAWGIDTANFLIDNLEEGDKVVALRILPGVDVLETRWAAAEKLFDEAGIEAVDYFTGADPTEIKKIITDELTKGDVNGRVDGRRRRRRRRDRGLRGPGRRLPGDDRRGRDVLPPQVGGDRADRPRARSTPTSSGAPRCWRWRRSSRASRCPLSGCCRRSRSPRTSASDFLEANDGMPDGHYAKFGGEDLPGYPEVWQERQIP